MTADFEDMAQPRASSAESVAPVLESRAQVQALLRGQMGAAPALWAKMLDAWRARRQLRRCTRIGRYVRVRGRVHIMNQGTILLGERVNFVATLVPCELLAYHNARLEIGPRAFINYGCSIAANTSITIGPDCLLGPFVNIIDNDYHAIEDRRQQPVSRPVSIGASVWIGTRAIILPGVTIGDGAVIGAGSVVTRDVAPYTVVAGNPARVLRTI